MSPDDVARSAGRDPARDGVPGRQGGPRAGLPAEGVHFRVGGARGQDRSRPPTGAMNVLGIESSCDETAAAVVADGRRILSSVVASQIDIHRKYGGVVPELASREHLRQIVPVVREALMQVGMKLSDVDAIGVTQGPGLV